MLFTQLDSGLPISNIVLMGIGEPLDNFDNVLRFLELVNSPDGHEHRHAAYQSLSTCGLVPKIDELAERRLQLTLSVSLHAPGRRGAGPDHAGEPGLSEWRSCWRPAAGISRRPAGGSPLSTP